MKNNSSYPHARLITAMSLAVLFVAACGVGIARCTANNYEIPKPEAYPYIEPYDSVYVCYDSLPVSFDINAAAQTKIIPSEMADTLGIKSNWLNIRYPRYEATLHCTALRGNNALILSHLENRKKRIEMNLLNIPAHSIHIEDPDNKFTSELFFSSGESMTPIQFLATDSNTFILSGALRFDREINDHDSVSPVIEYITRDIVQMLQTVKIH